MSGDFYIGYLPQSAPTIARHVKGAAIALLLLAGGISGLLVATMGQFSDAVFEFGVERDFEGVVLERPVPALVLERPGSAEHARGTPETSSYLLVDPGKFGAGEAVAGLEGRRVRLRGSLIYRDEQTMIELAEGSIQELEDDSTSASVAEEDLGLLTLTGEIVDSKCFLGVMKPGNLKPHRACAVRCISGGVPPVLAVEGAGGFTAYYLLLSADGRAVNAEVLDRVAEPLVVEGRVVRRGTLTFLYADPSTYRRPAPASAPVGAPVGAPKGAPESPPEDI